MFLNELEQKPAALSESKCAPGQLQNFPEILFLFNAVFQADF